MRGGPAARARAGAAPSPCALHNVPTCAALTCHNSAGTGRDEPIGARLAAGGGAAWRGRTFPTGQRRVARGGGSAGGGGRLRGSAPALAPEGRKAGEGPERAFQGLSPAWGFLAVWEKGEE